MSRLAHRDFCGKRIHILLVSISITRELSNVIQMVKTPLLAYKVVNITKEMLLSDVWKRDWKAIFPVDRSEPTNFCKSK